MKKNISLLLLALICMTALQAQESMAEQQARLDSSQRVLMKDSLQMTDAQVDTVFAIRNRHWEAIAAVRANSTFTVAQQLEQFAALKQETYTAMRTALGTTLFDRYTQLISSRAQRRNNANAAAPLTGANN